LYELKKKHQFLKVKKLKILKLIKENYNKKLPFVAYRKPNQKDVSGIFQLTDKLHVTTTFSEDGFVFSPFDTKENTILFPLKDAVFLEEKLEIFSSSSSTIDLNPQLNTTRNQEKEFHEKLVEKGIEAIKRNQFKKVVFSRKEEVALSNFDIVEVFTKLLQNYENAFVYVWFHPKVGLWLGATPETLLKVRGNSFETMALAGTQPNLGTTDVIWKQKELEEQQFVTDYIVENLTNIGAEPFTSDIETVQAGSLLHLKTVITGKLQTNSIDIKDVISKLHPTPAVCGLPKEKAKKFILENEKYNRAFYTGFLGELNISHQKSDVNSSALYVNLRCMAIDNNVATLFIGGGITKDSNPEKEWDETVGKSAIMKKVLLT